MRSTELQAITATQSEEPDRGGVLVVGERPDEWIILGPAAASRALVDVLDRSGHVSMIDYTHSRALFRLTGAVSASVAEASCDLVRNDLDGVRSYLIPCDRAPWPVPVRRHTRCRPRVWHKSRRRNGRLTVAPSMNSRLPWHQTSHRLPFSGGGDMVARISERRHIVFVRGCSAFRVRGERLRVVLAGVAVLVLATAVPGGSTTSASDGGGVHQPGIDALTAAGIAAGTGCEPGHNCWGEPIRRWVMAVWLTRALDSNEPLPVESSRFRDVETDLWWSAHVERLAELKVTKGCATDKYCPDRSVTRAQMATFLTRAFDLEPAATSSGFTDVDPDSVHSAAIGALAAANITAGCAAGKYCPGRSVTRGQMATFLARALGLIPRPTPTPMSELLEMPSIRSGEVHMGIYPCCADLAFWQIPIQLGWWQGLNITLSYSYFTSSQEIIPWLESDRGDVAQSWAPNVFPSLETFGQDIPPIHLADIYVGYAILVAPDSDAKTTLEFMDEGMSFPEAARAAVEQLVGEEIHIPPHSTLQAQYTDAFFAYLPRWWESPFEGSLPALDSQGNQLVLLNREGSPVLDENGNRQPIRITPDDWRHYASPVYIDDPTIVQLSDVPGRIEFAMPYGAPILVQMIRNGWDPLISFAMMYEHDAASPQTAIASASGVGGTGLLARREWVEENKDLAYRVVSVANRTLAYLEDPDTRYQGWRITADLINRARLRSFEPEDIGILWEVIQPSFDWEDQEALWDLSLPSYHPENAFATQVERLKANGVLSEAFNTQAELEAFLLAKEIYRDMKGFQDGSDDLFAKASGMSLSRPQQFLVDLARSLYDRYNFYDALRFLEAAQIA